MNGKQTDAHILLWLGFLLPLFTLFGISPQESAVSKVALVCVGAGGAFLFFLWRAVRSHSLSLGNHLIFSALLLLLGVLCLSSFLSLRPPLSFFGETYGMDSFLVLLLLSFLFFITAQVIRSERGVTLLLLAIALSFFGWCAGEALRFSLHGSAIFRTEGFLIGTGRDVALFCGSIFLLSILLLQSSVLSRRVSIFLSLTAVLSFFFFCFFAPFGMVGTLAFFICLSFVGTEWRRGKETRPSALLLFSVGALLLFSLFSSFVPHYVEREENIPSRGMTFDVVRQSITTEPLRALLGSGLGTFGQAWLLGKPSEVQYGPLWDKEVTTGSNPFLTLLGETGLVGAFTLLLLLFVYIWYGILYLSRSSSQVFFIPFLLSLFLSSTALWYGAHFSLGVLVSLYAGMAVSFFLERRTYALPSGSVQSFSLTFFALLFLIPFVGGLLFLCRDMYATGQFEEALRVEGVEGRESAIPFAERASLSLPRETYLRTLGKWELKEAQETDGRASRTHAEKGLVALRSATEEGGDYHSYVLFARLTAFYAPFSSSAQKKNIIYFYAEAVRLNPRDPSLLLESAQASLFVGNRDSARTLAHSALTLKGDFKPAEIFLESL